MARHSPTDESGHTRGGDPVVVRLEAQADEGFAAWLCRLPGCLLVSTYQAHKLVLLGWDGKRVTVLPRQLDKPMGLTVSAGPGRPARIAVATRHEVTVFADAPPLAHDYLPDEPGRYDSLFLPRVTYHTNDLNTHDLAWAGSELWMVNTRFSCLATPSHEYAFLPRWKPAWVTELAPEDRCHLNGLATVGGRPKYVTALGETDSPVNRSPSMSRSTVWCGTASTFTRTRSRSWSTVWGTRWRYTPTGRCGRTSPPATPSPSGSPQVSSCSPRPRTAVCSP